MLKILIAEDDYELRQLFSHVLLNLLKNSRMACFIIIIMEIVHGYHLINFL